MPSRPSITYGFYDRDELPAYSNKLSILKEFLLGTDIIDGELFHRKLVHVETEEHVYDLENDEDEFFFKGNYVCLNETDSDGGYVHFINEEDIIKIGYENIPMETETDSDNLLSDEEKEEWSNY